MSARDAGRQILRALAIIIAVAAAVDPAIQSPHASKPEISVVAANPRRDSALTERVARELDKSFAVTRGPFPTDATVIVGDAPPVGMTELSSPVYAVTPDRSGPTVTLAAVRAPTTAPFDARVPVTAVARVTGARGRTVEFSLHSDSIVVDRAIRTVSSNDERVSAPMGFLPTAVGTAALRVSAAIVNGTTGEQVAAADFAVDVRDARWSVLFYDPRPSWMATFVRRTVERDRRFVVTSRVVTSRNVSTDAGLPPALSDLSSLSRFDAVVVGAPEALTDANVAGLDAYLRRRGGSVVLLMDQRAPGQYDRLTAAGAWSTKSVGSGISLAVPGSDSAGLRAAEIVWPTVLPVGAEPLALSLPSRGDTTRGRPVVWQSHIGAGRLVVSGALDAWRFRDRSQSGFDRFWRTIVADAANAAPPPISVLASSGTLAPGETTVVTVTLRSAALSVAAGDGAATRPVAASASAALVGSSAAGARRDTLTLWPAGPIGDFRTVVRAPSTPGVYRVVVSSDGATAAVSIVVSPAASHAASSALDLLAAWIAARGGHVISASQPRALTAALVGALRPTPRMQRWHPMRSPWWLVPFALALCAEWWLRRRRGLA